MLEFVIPHGAGLHTPAALAVVLGTVGARKEPVFKGGMWHMMAWHYRDAAQSRRRQERESGPLFLVSNAKAPVLMGFTALSNFFFFFSGVMKSCVNVRFSFWLSAIPSEKK